MGIRFSPQANASHYLDVLLKAAEESNGKFDVFTHETMPEHWHFTDNERIAPIYVVPRVGYALTNRVENGSGMSKGVSVDVRLFAGQYIDTRIFRITDTTTTIHPCTPYSLRMDRSPL